MRSKFGLKAVLRGLAQRARADPARWHRAHFHRLPEDPASREKLLELLEAMQAPVRALVRVHSPYGADLGLYDPAWTDDALLDLVLERPARLNRPIVVTQLSTKACRTSETLLELLPAPRLRPFLKEDGSVVVDRGSRRW